MLAAVQALAVRPLGMAVVNGALWFSEGAKLYRRQDGAAPRFAVVHTMNASDVNPDLAARGRITRDESGEMVTAWQFGS